MNTQQNINQMFSLAGLLYTQSAMGEIRKDKRKANITANEEAKKAKRKAEAEKTQAGTEAEFAEAQEGFDEEKVGIAYRRFVATGEGKEDLAKAEAELEVSRNLAYNLRHQEELDNIAEEYDTKHNIEHIPSPARARAEQNRQAADAAEVERINKSNEAIEQLKPYEEMIRRAGSYYTGGERLDK